MTLDFANDKDFDDGQPAALVPSANEQLQAIINRHRQTFDQRGYDYALRGEPVKLARGSPEHAQAFRRAPQWHQHIGIGPNGRKANIIDLIRSEARQTLGPDAAAAVETML